MVNDHLSDFIARVRNGYQARMSEVEVPAIKAIERVAEVMSKEGYIKGVEKKNGKLIVTLKYQGRKPVIMGIKRVSKPGVRYYSGIDKLPKVWGGLGITILSTNKGVMSNKEARKQKVGGEVICQIW
jgi:small subunit ribosomal protein S8